MADLPDDVRLVIAGTELTGWTGITLDMAIDHIADGLAISAPWDPETSPLRRLVKPYGYERVQLYIGDDLLFTGLVYKPAPALGDDRTIALEARSLTASIVDCSVEGDLEFSGLTLAGIARKVCRPVGVTVRADYDTAAIQEARAEYGQRIGDFLNSLAAPRGFLLNSAYDGRLVLTDGRTLGVRPPVACIVEGTPGPGELALLSVSSSYDGTGRYSKYRVATQFAGTEDITGESADSGVPVYRPLLVVAGDSDTDPGQTARRLRTEALASSVGVSVTVSGWRRPDGQRWAERQTVTLRAPSVMCYTESPWIVAGVTMSLDAGSGRTTSLRLVLPDTYSGQSAGGAPWA